MKVKLESVIGVCVVSVVTILLVASSAQAQNLFAGDNSGDIVEFTPGGAQSTFASGLSTVWGLAFNSAGNLFASDLSGHIYQFTPGGVRTTSPQPLSPRYSSGEGDGKRRGGESWLKLLEVG